MPQHQLLFVNLPVADLARSRAFFTQLGYRFDDAFCDGESLCLRLGPAHFAMLLRADLFADFHDQPSAPPGAVESVLCLTADSREQVDALVDRAVLAGGRDVRRSDLGFLYGRSYSDLDGHVWEVMWMDPDPRRGGAADGAGARVEDGTRAGGVVPRLDEEMR